MKNLKAKDLRFSTSHAISLQIRLLEAMKKSTTSAQAATESHSPQYSKIDVNGDNAIPLYKWITEKTKYEGSKDPNCKSPLEEEA